MEIDWDKYGWLFFILWLAVIGSLWLFFPDIMSALRTWTDNLYSTFIIFIVIFSLLSGLGYLVYKKISQ